MLANIILAFKKNLLIGKYFRSFKLQLQVSSQNSFASGIDMLQKKFEINNLKLIKTK